MASPPPPLGDAVGVGSCSHRPRWGPGFSRAARLQVHRTTCPLGSSPCVTGWRRRHHVFSGPASFHMEGSRIRPRHLPCHLQARDSSLSLCHGRGGHWVLPAADVHGS